MSNHERTDRRRRRGAVPPPGLRRHRRQADRHRGPGAVRLAVPLLPRRQGAARRRGDPDLGRAVRAADPRRVRPRARPRRPAFARSSPAPPSTSSRPTTPTRARSRRSRSRSRAAASRCARRAPTCSRAGSPPAPRAAPAPGSVAEQARELTIAMIAALEGAFVLARALRSTEPLEIAGEMVARRSSAH